MTMRKIERYLKNKKQTAKTQAVPKPTKECNFSDDYYGDQVCLLKPQT